MEPMGIERHRLIEDQPVRAELLGCNCVKPSLRREPYLCSIKITEDVRNYAAEQGIAEIEALESGMQETRKEFQKQGAEPYANA